MIHVYEVIRCYPTDCQPVMLEPLGSCGGLSGALFWRLSSPRGTLCLRRWPTVHPDRERLLWIHRAVRFAAARCRIPLPVPIETRDEQSLVEMNGHLWELTPWLEGEPLEASQWDSERLAAAAAALAEVHLALAAFAACEREPGSLQIARGSVAPHTGSAPGVARRSSLLQQADLHLRQAVVRGIPDDDSIAAPLRLLADTMAARWYSVSAAVAWELKEARNLQVPLQPCLRDIWHPHFFFRGNAVSGIVDFGALAVDSVAADIARFLGSVGVHQPEAWEKGLVAYEDIRRLSREERVLAAMYDRSGVLLSGVNWLRWLAIERRPFPPEADVRGRLTDLRRRLQTLPETFEAHPAVL